MNTNTHRVAVIGRTGRGDYGHWLDKVWRDLKEIRGNVEIVAVADENEAGARQSADRIGAPRTYTDYRQMLERERPRFVTVAPRHADCHREMILACAAAGANVFTEKPLCPTPAEADEIAAACERAGVKLAIAHHMRYLPEVARAKEMIAAGDIGEVLEVRGRGKEDARGGGEDLMLLGSHLLDLFRFFLGDPAWCFARVHEGGEPATTRHVRPGGEGIGPIAGDRIDAVYGGFSASPITPAYFTSCRGAGSTPSRFGATVVATKGALSFEPSSPEKAYVTDDPRWGRGDNAWRPITVQPDDVTKHLGGAQWLQHANVRIAADLIEAVEQHREPHCGMREARATLEMIWATYESHRTQAAAPLPLRSREHPLSRWA